MTNNALTVTIMGKKNPEEDYDVQMTSYVESKIGKNGCVAVANIVVRKDGAVVKERTVRSSYKSKWIKN